MSMQLISEKLLEAELLKVKDNPEFVEENELFYSLCKKELALLSKLKIDKIDLSGDAEEVKERIQKYHVYFFEPGEYKEMAEKALRYDMICGIINK